MPTNPETLEYRRRRAAEHEHWNRVADRIQDYLDSDPAEAPVIERPEDAGSSPATVVIRISPGQAEVYRRGGLPFPTEPTSFEVSESGQPVDVYDLREMGEFHG